MASKEAQQREKELRYLRQIASEARSAPPPVPVEVRELELGGAAVGLRARGYSWYEIADGLRQDVETIRRHAARYLIWRDRQANGEPPAEAPERAAT